MFGHRFCYKLLQYEISSHHSLEENIEQIKIDNLCRFVDVLWIPQAEHVGTDCESSTIEWALVDLCWNDESTFYIMLLVRLMSLSCPPTATPAPQLETNRVRLSEK